MNRSSDTNTPNIGYVGTAIATMVPTTSGGAVATNGWSISPSLPSGLNFDSSNGQISGNPNGESNQEYTVTASNATDSSTFKVTIVVYPALPG